MLGIARHEKRKMNINCQHALVQNYLVLGMGYSQNMSIPFTNNNPQRNSIIPQEEQGPTTPNVQRGSESQGEGYRRNTGSTFHEVLANLPSPEEDHPPQEISQSARRHSSRAENSLLTHSPTNLKAVGAQHLTVIMMMRAQCPSSVLEI
jgi:hypothetical protein